ncbi:MAG: hypothetical protein F6K25_24505 [Okeania sp. SIO2G4]|uniref:hypothetical protein n=1 Tax=unclassified Okeania TaxID=2634635 RepID=UPI0013B753CB|nr:MULTISPECIES: hypothetical protein [unclassified Okeania]NEP07133.1 hypothetical protein [Okeania sp. SIO4D6]NEP94303.1 hypothetical protein [Okeania sp. SIO2F5]NEQ93650.1 hypothetical protein [Okeania sp. SIO2G4]
MIGLCLFIEFLNFNKPVVIVTILKVKNIVLLKNTTSQGVWGNGEMGRWKPTPNPSQEGNLGRWGGGEICIVYLYN